MTMRGSAPPRDLSGEKPHTAGRAFLGRISRAVTRGTLARSPRGGSPRQSFGIFSNAATRNPPDLAGLPTHTRSTGCRGGTALSN